MGDYKNLNILIIDDEEDLCDALSILLEDSFNKIYTSTNSGNGLKILNENHIDFSVIDLNLDTQDPHSGQSLIKEIHNNPNYKCKIILATGEQVLDKNLQKYYQGILYKPFNEKELYNCLNEIIAS